MVYGVLSRLVPNPPLARRASRPGRSARSGSVEPFGRCRAARCQFVPFGTIVTEAQPLERSFEAHLLDTNLSGVRVGYGLAAVLMPAGVLLDWVTHPTNALSFFWIRLGT